MSAPSLWERLERMLHREHNAILVGHRDLMTRPLDERVDRGDSLAGLRFETEAEGGRIVLRCGDNLAKHRTGDALRLSNEDAEEGDAGLAVIYESFDDQTGALIVSRDPFRPAGVFDRRRTLRLDPEAQSLTSLGLESIARVRSGRSPEAIAAREVLEGIAPRTVDRGTASAATALVAGIVPALDPSQTEAFVQAIAAHPVTLIQGPPGTGKTRVLAAIAVALARRGQRVLVAAPTHRAVNHALRTICSAGPELALVKAGKTSGADDLARTPVRLVSSLRRLAPPDGTPRVIGATLYGMKHAWEAGAYDVVVVDEAAQVPIAFACCALLCAPRYVLVGDHRQLGPIVQGRHAEPLATRSVFEHLAESYPPALLSTTYRMNGALASWPSRVFYGGKLVPSADAARGRFFAVPGGPLDDAFDPERPAVLALVAHEGFRTRCEPEARLVADLVLDRIVRQGGRPSELAVVSPYRAQLRLVRSLVRRGLAAARRHALPVIDTVERIQGQERDLVIVSLAASDPDDLVGEAAAFFYAAPRLNVTITRARTKLIVVASPRVFEAFPRTLEGLIDVERFRALRHAWPAIDCTERAGLTAAN